MPLIHEVTVPAHWREFYDATGVPAAVTVGETVRLTGHTGTTADGSFPAEVSEQVRQTFRNIGDTLSQVGCTWADVVELVSYHVGLRAQAEMLLAVATEFREPPFPAWTAVGVTELFEPEALVEISCVAALRGSRPARHP